MKQEGVLGALLLLALTWSTTSLSVATGLVLDSPVTRVVQLLRDLKSKIQEDGAAELQSYDKFACWCESTLARKASDINTGKDRIAELRAQILQLGGELGVHGAKILQLNKDIDANKKSQAEATELRRKEETEFVGDKTESEQCVGALEAAINVLKGAGTKNNFLERAQDAQLLSIVSSVRKVIETPVVSHSVSRQDLQLVKRFVARSEEVVRGRMDAVSAAQMTTNPFGDYAPQSTQIQGILKGMYDAFASDLEKGNVEEAKSVKAFQEFMTTKRQELNTLDATLERQTLDKAKKQKQHADSRKDLGDAEEQLEADEKFFADTKDSCSVKAREWNSRMRLRTEELAGMNQAIQILSNADAQKTFVSANQTFLQLSRASEAVAGEFHRSQAYAWLSALVTRRHSTSLTKVASALNAGGHFDKVILMIDHMISVLRQEEQDDIAHRDRCHAGADRNINEKEDLGAEIAKAGTAISRMNNTKTSLESEMQRIMGDIESTEQSMTQRLEMRNEEHDEFLKALKVDTEAVGLIRDAINALMQFYKNNKIPMSLSQTSPEYTKDVDKAPETTWQGGDYGGRKSESTGIISILSMIAEDLEKEMSTSRQDDATAQADYERDRAAQQRELNVLKAAKVANEEKKTAVDESIQATSAHKNQQQEDLDAEQKMTTALENDCTWVDTHFDSRRDKRKSEIEGLQEAKTYLAGIDSGADNGLPIL